MNKPKIIESLINKYQDFRDKRFTKKVNRLRQKNARARELEDNKPQYAVKDLEIGSIVLIKKEQYRGCDLRDFWYKTIKKDVLLTGRCGDYKLIAHNVTLPSSTFAHSGEQCILSSSVSNLANVYPNILIKNNLTPETLLSRRQIIELEKELTVNNNSVFDRYDY